MNFTPEAASQFCEEISLARGIPQLLRDQARHQLYFQAPRSDVLFPSWQHKRLTFIPPPGLRQMNPSITRYLDQTVCLLRCTDYEIDDHGPHRIEGGRVGSRNFLLEIDPDTLQDKLIHEIVLPKGFSDEALAAREIDFSDARIFEKNGYLWTVSVICFKNHEGWPEQWLGVIEDNTFAELTRLKSPKIRRMEKNWVPFVDQFNRTLFLYLCDPTIVVDRESSIVIERYPRIAADHFRGSSQGIEFDEGMLALTHSVTMHKEWPKNLHRFVWFTRDFDLARISPCFTFPPCFSTDVDYLNGYQYGMGLCWHPDNHRLMLSYSIGDGASFLAMIESADIEKSLREV